MVSSGSFRMWSRGAVSKGFPGFKPLRFCEVGNKVLSSNPQNIKALAIVWEKQSSDVF